MASSLPHNKIVTEPNIVPIGQMALDVEQAKALLLTNNTAWGDGTPERSPQGKQAVAEWLVEFAGRVCYWSFGKRASKRTHAEYLENLFQQKHGSVFEHAVFSFYVDGVSRTLTHELLRHRVGVGISQISQRYVSDPALLRFVLPPALCNTDPWSNARRLWEVETVRAAEAYEALYAALSVAIEMQSQQASTALRTPSGNQAPQSASSKHHKQVAEAARSLLPQCVETRFVWTVNVRALRHVLIMRGGLAADAEFRRFAIAMAEVIEHQPALKTFFPDLSVVRPAGAEPYVELAYGEV